MTDWIELNVAFGAPHDSTYSLEESTAELMLGCALEASSRALLDIRVRVSSAGGMEVRFGDAPRDGPFRGLIELGNEFSSKSWKWVSWEDFFDKNQQKLEEEATRHGYASLAASRLADFRDCCPDVYRCLEHSSGPPLSPPDRAIRRICPVATRRAFSTAAVHALVPRVGEPIFSAFNGRVDDLATFPLRDDQLRKKVVEAIIQVIWATVNGTVTWWEAAGSHDGDRGQYVWLSGSEVTSLEAIVESSPHLPGGEGSADVLEELISTLDEHYVRLVMELASGWSSSAEPHSRSLFDKLFRGQ